MPNLDIQIDLNKNSDYMKSMTGNNFPLETI